MSKVEDDFQYAFRINKVDESYFHRFFSKYDLEKNVCL